ncbi:Immunoglobulin E-set [Rhypophila sp. PSN 637]
MAGDDLMPENESGYKLAQPKQTLAEYQKMDENDASLQRYKESLGLGGGKDLSDPNDPRVCIILSLSMESPGREPVVIDLSAPGSEKKLKDKPFKIKAGAKFTMIATFKVQHEILSGLHYVQSIKYLGIRIPGGKSSEMIGSYAPNTDKTPVYVKKFAEEEAPNMNKKFGVHSKFIDDDGKTHLEFDWAFQIDKDW